MASFSEVVRRVAGEVGPCFGLPEEIRRAELAVHRLVGDDQGLGGPREEVDADPAEELALGLRDEHVPGPDEHVHRLDGLGAEGHCADRLDAPRDSRYLVRAAKILGRPRWPGSALPPRAARR